MQLPTLAPPPSSFQIAASPTLHKSYLLAGTALVNIPVIAFLAGAVFSLVVGRAPVADIEDHLWQSFSSLEGWPTSFGEIISVANLAISCYALIPLDYGVHFGLELRSALHFAIGLFL